MPRAPKQRTTLHVPAVRLGRRQFALPDAKVIVQPGHEPKPKLVPDSTPSTKDKRQKRLDSLARQIASRTQLYSKSHARRLKRKARDTLHGDGLSSVDQALNDLVAESNPQISTSSKIPNSAVERVVSTSSSLKESNLTAARLRKILKTEQSRIPAIIGHPDFAANPFSTIRLHAANTLEKRSLPRQRSRKDDDPTIS